VNTDAVSKNEPSRETSLAIIGIGCLFPQSDDRTAYWATVREGIDAITEIPPTHWRTEDYFSADQKTADHTYGRRGGFISPVSFNPMEFNIPPNTLEAIDTSQLLGLVAAGQALKDAGYGADREYDRDKVSVILGVTGTLELVIPLGARLGHPVWRNALKEAGVDDTVAEDVVQRISDSYVPWQENSFPGLLGNVVAGRISKQFDLGGTNCVVDAACASSFSALHLASMELASGKADMVVTGGIDTFNDIFMYMCFSKTPALSPTGNAKPFDASGDGTILGEGLGIVVIKRLADAERDGDRIYAVIRGVGSSSDGKGDAIYAPSAAGQKKALLDAYDRAGVTPQSIGMVEAHGTGTKVGDAVEVSALREIYGEADRPWCALGSVKAQIGHTKAAAGAAGLIKAALALHHKVIPPTIKVSRPLDEVTAGRTPFYLATEKRPWLAAEGAPRRAAVSAFGFGGSNFHTVLEEYRPEKAAADWDGSIQILPFAGSDAGEIEAILSELPTDLAWNDLRARAAVLRSVFEQTAPCRLALVVEQRKTNLAALVGNAQAMLRKQPAASWQTPDGAFFAVNDKPGKLGLLFPGQGAQYTGMLRDLACSFPEVFSVLADADAGFADSDGTRLSERIYPLPAFDPGARERQEDALRATEVAQPAIGAVSLGALRLLESFGVTAEATAGHSYGELTALCAAGRIDEPEFHRLSRLRGSLMAAGAGDKGSMLAVSAPLETVAQVLADEALDLVIANRNAPSQAVLSGKSAVIDRAAAAFAARNLTGKRLPVAAAFHSPLVADAAEPFRTALAEVAFAGSGLPVYANTTAGEYPADPGAARELLAGQLARPVEFVSEVEAMYAAGIRTFVEVGPGARLTGLVKAILGNRPHLALAVDASSGRNSGVADLARILAQLAVHGHDIRLATWDPDYRPAAAAGGKKPAMTIPLSGANYVKPRPKRPPVAPTPPVASTVPATATAPEPPPLPLQTAAPAASHATLAESLRVTRESMALLQKMQEETARLHRRFLEGQETASRTIQSLLENQRLLSQGAPIPSPQTVVVPVPAPAPPAPPAAAPSAITLPPPTPAAAAVPQAPLPQPAAAATADGMITQTLMTVVSEKTGYPVEMLEPDMGLDADLGIDSIKRVEILSALQERLPGSPVIGPEHLGTLHTLGEIAGFLGAGTASETHETHTTYTSRDSHTSDASSAAKQPDNIAATLLSVVSEKTGYPVEMLDLEMGMDADLGIDSIKRVEILSTLQERLPGAPVIGPEHLGTLHTLGEIARHLGAGTASETHTTHTTHTSHGSHTSDASSAAKQPDNIAATLLSVVSDKTGYPVEMLDLEMGMDADLGIDSIKRVEILSALQERLPGSPVIGPEHLGTLHTLGEIAGFLGAGTASETHETHTSHGSHTSDASSAAKQPDNIAATLLSVVSDKTGYPVEMLDLEMGMDADLGIDSIKRVEILSALQERLPHAPVIGPEHLGSLHTLGEIARHLQGYAAPATASVPAVTLFVPPPRTDLTAADAAVKRSGVVAVPLPETVSSGPLPLAQDAEFWLADDASPFTAALHAALQERGLTVRLVRVHEAEETLVPARIAGLVIPAPHAGTSDLFLENAFCLLKSAAPGLLRAAADGGALFATISRLDGAFGCGAGTTLADPLSGGLAGLAKTAGLEWPEVACKAIDLGEFAAATDAAAALAGEIMLKGPLEVGLSPSARVTLALADLPEAQLPDTLPLEEGDLVVITGGGRGVTAATAVALAEAYRPFLVLLGRSPEPASEPEWLAGISDESRIKRALLEHAGKKLHPREIEERFAEIIAGRELRITLDRIAATGAKAVYRSVDIRNVVAVAGLLTELRREHGPVRGLIHGAGVLADRLITDKTREQFAQVYGTKVEGLRSLLLATTADDLRVLALFSSTTGRFGRTGQLDYAVANEVLNKLAQAESRLRPGCRTVSINWGPWDGGMVTPSLKKVFAGEGIGLIGLVQGGDFLVREIAAASAPVEIVALAEQPGTVAGAAPPARTRALTEAFSRAMSVENYPFLRSHVLDGRAVLPMAMIVEMLAHGALHGNPGLRFHGFNDLRICKGVVFDQLAPCNLQVMAGRAEKRESFYTVPVELQSIAPDGRTILNARADIVLTARLPEGIRSISDLPSTPYTPHHGTIYHRERLFHGPDLHGIERVDGCSAKGIAAQVKGAPAPADWVRQPLRSSWLTDPLVIDSAFQLMILWSFERFGAGSLPCFAARYRQFCEAFPREGVQVVIRVTAEREHGATADMEFLDRHSGKLVARLEGYECVIDPSLQKAFERNQLQLGAA
jgi:acyl transferase domain-containing protein